MSPSQVKIISMGGTLAWDEEFNYAANPEATRRMLAAYVITNTAIADGVITDA